MLSILSLDVKCANALKSKDTNQHPAGLLQPLPIPDGKFHTCTIDFMADLPEINWYNELMVVMDKFGKL